MDNFRLAEMALVAIIMDIYQDASYQKVKDIVAEKIRQDLQEIYDKLNGKDA
jgi:hypothetical protein